MVSQDHQEDFHPGEGEMRKPVTLTMTTEPETNLCLLQIEDGLWESEERFRSLVAATGLIIWKADGQGNVQDGSLTWCAFTGQSQDDWLAGRWDKAIHPDDLEAVMRSWSEALATGSAHKVEGRLRRYDGVYRTFVLHAVPVHNEDGTILEWIGACSDQTEARVTETKLRESEQRLRDLADSMPLMVWTSQPDGASDYFNQRWFTYTGMTLEQTCGWGWQHALHPDDLPVCVGRWRDAVRSGEAYEVECRYRRFDGLYRWHLSRALPMHNNQGEIILWVGSCTDIDDHKEAEQKLALRARQQALIALLSQQALTGDELANLFATVTTRLPQVLPVDTCSIAEVLLDGSATHHWADASGAPMLEILAPEQATLTNYIFHASEPVIVHDCRSDTRFTLSSPLREHGIVSCLGVVISCRRQPFGVLTVFCTHARIFTPDEIHLLQTIANVLATAIERKQVQAELERTNSALQQANKQLEGINRAQNAFVSMVGHELRTSLTGIQGFSELMRDEDFSTREIKEYAADINADSRRLNRMITELLDLERMKSGRMTLNLEQIDLNVVIKDVVDHLRPSGPCHRFLLELAEALPQLTADGDKLTQVVTNLVNNAIKYSPDGGELVIASNVADDSIHISVHDNGIGMPLEALERVFDPYYRIESQGSQSIKGTGLGLPIVRQIVQMHGGRTWAESTLGHGSTFHVTLPYKGSPPAPPER